MTKLIPIENHILVKPLEEEATTKSGIILSNGKEKPIRGEVIAVGNSGGPTDVSVGDIVHFTKYAPDEVEIEQDGQRVKYLIIQHKSILAKEAK